MLVREAFEKYNSGVTITEIRDWLQSVGIKNSLGNDINYNNIHKLLRNRRYIGENILNAIQQGIFTKSTKERLEKLEAEKEEFEIRLSNEKMERPLIPEEFIYRWLRRFRDLDVTLLEHRKMLIDNFVNSIYLYDDKILVGINYIDRVEEIKFSDLEQCSDIKTGREPVKKEDTQMCIFFFLPCL